MDINEQYNAALQQLAPRLSAEQFASFRAITNPARMAAILGSWADPISGIPGYGPHDEAAARLQADEQKALQINEAMQVKSNNPQE